MHTHLHAHSPDLTRANVLQVSTLCSACRDQHDFSQCCCHQPVRKFASPQFAGRMLACCANEGCDLAIQSDSNSSYWCYSFEAECIVRTFCSCSRPGNQLPGPYTSSAAALGDLPATLPLSKANGRLYRQLKRRNQFTSYFRLLI